MAALLVRSRAPGPYTPDYLARIDSISLMTGRGEGHTALTKNPPPRRSCPKYTGTYQLRPGRNVVITLAGDQLMADQGRMGAFPISAESETLFLFEPPTEGPPSKFEFIKDERGAVTSLIWHTNRGDDLKAMRRP